VEIEAAVPQHSSFHQGKILTLDDGHNFLSISCVVEKLLKGITFRKFF
jgi:hypothetical protein